MQMTKKWKRRYDIERSLGRLEDEKIMSTQEITDLKQRERDHDNLNLGEGTPEEPVGGGGGGVTS